MLLLIIMIIIIIITVCRYNLFSQTAITTANFVLRNWGEAEKSAQNSSSGSLSKYTYNIHIYNIYISCCFSRHILSNMISLHSFFFAQRQPSEHAVHEQIHHSAAGRSGDILHPKLCDGDPSLDRVRHIIAVMTVMTRSD
jgi:hypothetical protein